MLVFEKNQILKKKVLLCASATIETGINYIHQNPVRTGLVVREEDYLYNSARNYAGMSIVLEMDEI